ncbi:DNA helicase [Pseudomonas asuensis]|uniref:DNA helicase n=1 Tax=Pseudomonas asuensis TaxID=1825787 RepID=A0ABQ2GXU3_9PSED|nr:DEAD/DEAH box helicase [Pseudomonas asuensis]GGM17539.1 DNA helicase [Pseudomonas asuensis]
MLSAVKRYLAGALSNYFPRTTEYLQSNADGPLSHPKPSKQAGSLLTNKLKSMVVRKPAQKGAARKKPEKTAKASVKRGKPTPATKKAQGKPATKRSVKPAGRAKKTTESEPKAHRATTEGLYGPTLLPVTEHHIQAMRERVAQAVKAGVIRAPSDEQWNMILSRSPATRIFAGAGSGKSTTLVLRVVFMLCHMDIKPEQLTVISFTNDSCAQLREQLIKVLSFWRFTFSTEQARCCVRTFHSAMGALAKDVLGAPAWFEQLSSRKASPTELDNPLTGGRLHPAQLELLRQAYERAYSQVPAFKKKVDKLLNTAGETNEDDRNKTAPLKPFKLEGEYVGVPLFEAFYAQAGFIESLGLRVSRLQSDTLKCSVREQIFIEALVLFWRVFETCLKEKGLLTFNRAFQELTDRLNRNDRTVRPDMLEPFSHLLIDEFQDISPQIVLWLQAVQGFLARQKTTLSLMAIGDDWQSIYGWRGSSPELFMDFDRHFPGQGRNRKSSVLMLATNYRSVEPIIRDGEKVLAGVTFKQEKTCHAFKSVMAGDHGVQAVTRFDFKSRLPDLIKEIQAQCLHVASRKSSERTAVLVLSRRNETLKAIQSQLDKALPVRCYTIHRAKGLQGEVAIIVDDGGGTLPHPLRNALYAASGFFQNTYDQAMADEALRLSYVAITRGVSRVLWYTTKPSVPF